jgi:hypothetical protein
MSLTTAEIQTVLDTWPEDDALPASVKLLFDGWQELRMPMINAAVQALNDDPTSGFTTPSGRGYHKIHKYRTLTMHGVSVAALRADLPRRQRKCGRYCHRRMARAMRCPKGRGF